MENIQNSQTAKLAAKGVDIPCPQSVLIAEDVDIQRISGQRVRIYPGCRISGSSTLILAGAQLGSEAPVTVENCQIGPDVSLKGGFFRQSVFLEKASAGFGAHVREGCIFEEKAGIAHTVGLKQTILFPFVTLGSLINFCDCLLSGGTGPKDHSEVGSSYIHFNYTPNQDKATPSLLGDVPRGVMLRQKPVFLGGQGGLVGPCRLEFGTVIAAGCVWRKDELRPNRLLICGAGRGGSMPFSTGVYQNVKRILVSNFIYIANLAALGQWYAQLRSLFVSERFPLPLLDGLKEKITMGIAERIRRLGELADKMPGSIAAYQAACGENASLSLSAQKKEFHEKWPHLAEIFQNAQAAQGNAQMRDAFLKTVERQIQEKGKDCISVIQSLTSQEAETGTCWLQDIVDKTVNAALEMMPSLGLK